MSTDLFNEDTLRAAIVDRWGEHGAHADVFDHMLKLISKLENDENEDMAQEREYRRVVELDNAEMRVALAAGVKLLRTVYGSSGDFAFVARQWVSDVEGLL